MLKPFLTTGIGSMPHKDVDEALRLILEKTDVPFWPQLPHRIFLEQMIVQYSEGIPGIVLQDDRIYIKPSQESLNRFYEEYSEEKVYPISRQYAEGLFRFIEKTADLEIETIKGQTTGPVTLSLSLKFPDGRAVFYDPEYREILLLVLKGKTKWQIKTLSDTKKKVIIFIDEPILTALGSSTYISVDTGEAMTLIEEIVKTIKAEGAIAGVHCCGRADWTAVIRTGIDILNFDAYQYFDSLLASAPAVEEFFGRNGLIAWGIVPTTEDINIENKESLLKKMDFYFKELGKYIPEETIRKHSLLTPSCGAGSRSVIEAEKIFDILKQLGDALK